MLPTFVPLHNVLLFLSLFLSLLADVLQLQSDALQLLSDAAVLPLLWDVLAVVTITLRRLRDHFDILCLWTDLPLARHPLLLIDFEPETDPWWNELIAAWMRLQLHKNMN